MGATGCARGSWRCCRRAARPLCVATCAVNSCATRGSISPLVYPQLLATKDIMSTHTVGLGRAPPCCAPLRPQLSPRERVATSGVRPGEHAWWHSSPLPLPRALPIAARDVDRLDQVHSGPSLPTSYGIRAPRRLLPPARLRCR